MKLTATSNQRQEEQASMAVYIVERVTITRERFRVEADSPQNATLGIHAGADCVTSVEVDTQISEEGQAKPKGRQKGSGTKGTRLPPDWQPDRAYATSKGMNDPEIDREAEKFRNYWGSKPGAGGLKLDWNRTWYTWCLNFCERAGRSPRTSSPGESVMSNAHWIKALELYWRNQRWHRDFGPEPGRPGCKVPAHLLPEGMRKVPAIAAPKAPNLEPRPDLFVR